MKNGRAIFDVVLHGMVAILAGGLAFRACMTGRGFGNLPGIAILAGVGTGMIAFIFSLIFVELAPERYRQRVQGGMIALLMAIHLLNF